MCGVHEMIDEGLVTLAANAQRQVRRRAQVDPTRSITLRRMYQADMIRRFRRLQILIRDAVLVNDVFGLKPGTVFRVNAKAPPPGAFGFKRSGAKVQSFMEWLKRAEADEILEIQEGTPLSTAAARSWQNKYLKTAYHKGLSHSATSMRSAGATVDKSWLDGAFNRPVHADRAGLIYTRAYTELDGITKRMDQRISRTLAQGIAEGQGVEVLSKALVQAAGIEAARAAMLTRTETIAAHAAATLNGYREAQIEGVLLESEFTTAGDNKVCPRCQALEGKIFTIEEAEGVIPVHPNCRCAWNPVVSNPRGVVLR